MKMRRGGGSMICWSSALLAEPSPVVTFCSRHEQVDPRLGCLFCLICFVVDSVFIWFIFCVDVLLKAGPDGELVRFHWIRVGERYKSLKSRRRRKKKKKGGGGGGTKATFKDTASCSTRAKITIACFCKTALIQEAQTDPIVHQYRAQKVTRGFPMLHQHREALLFTQLSSQKRA